jgi:hypothetical protein
MARKKREIEELSATIAALAAPGLKPKELMKAVKTKHPGGSGKDITRAALFAMIESAERNDQDKAKRLQEFSIAERSVD